MKKSGAIHSFLLHRLFIYAGFGLFVLGQVGRISFWGQEINLYLYEPVLVLYGLYLLYLFRLRPLGPAFARITLALLGLLLFSLLINMGAFSWRDNVVAFLYFVRLSFYFLFFVYLLPALKQEEVRSLVKKGLVGTAIVIVPLSLGQYFLYPDLRNLFYLGWDPHLYRIFGLFFDAFLSSAVFGVILLFLVFLGDGKRQFQLLRWGLIVIYLIFMALTYSRSLYLAVLFTAALFFARRHLRFFLLGLILFAAVLVFLPRPFGEGVNLTRTFSIASRIEDYRLGLALWSKKPVLGYGYNHIRPLKAKEKNITGSSLADHSGASFHSSFMNILVTGGILGLLLYVAVLTAMARLSFEGGVVVFFLSILSFTDNVLLHPFLMFLLSFVLPYYATRPSRTVR